MIRIMEGFRPPTYTNILFEIPPSLILEFVALSIVLELTKILLIPTPLIEVFQIIFNNIYPTLIPPIELTLL